jgi:hypothetical protein
MLELQDFFQNIFFKTKVFLFDRNDELIVFYYLRNVSVEGEDAIGLFGFSDVIVVFHDFFHALV